MTSEHQPSPPAPRAERPDDPPGARPPYEPPRVLKKRALSRATLFTGQGPEGPPAAGPALVASG